MSETPANPVITPVAAVSPRIGVCSWSLRPASPADLIEALTRLGLVSVQLDLSTVISDPKIWGNGVKELRKAGVSIVSGMMRLVGENYATLETIRLTGGVRPDATWDANQKHAIAVAGLAQDHNIELVTFHAGFIPEDVNDPEHAKLVERLRSLADTFADHGVKIAFETGQETADTLIEALQAIDRTNVGVNFDPANMILYGTGDPVESLKQLSPFVKQVHIKDALPTDAPGTWGREMPVGKGEVDWPAFVKVADAVRPAVNFVIEREAGEGREPDIAAARDMLMKHT
jgi:sugar phosphate isomerase/epimerase